MTYIGMMHLQFNWNFNNNFFCYAPWKPRDCKYNGNQHCYIL